MRGEEKEENGQREGDSQQHFEHKDWLPSSKQFDYSDSNDEARRGGRGGWTLTHRISSEQRGTSINE
jgi:hypothetical protein